METVMLEMLQQAGLGAIPSLIVYLILHNKIEGHQKDYEKILSHKFDKMYERLNPLCDAVNKIQGYLEAKNDKS